MIRMLFAAVTAAVLNAGTVYALPYCDALLTRETLPKAHAKRAPIRSDQNSGWVIGRDQLKDNYAVTPEVSALWDAIRDEFAQRGSTLVVVAAPPRPLFVPAGDLSDMGLSHDAISASVGSNFKSYIKGLNAAGIPAPDLSDIAQSPARERFYFKRDTHWTPEGAAQAIARLAKMRNVLAPEVPFDGSFEEPGSLTDIVEQVCGFRPAPEVVPAPIYAKAGTADSLFADTKSAMNIALVGTSFSNRYQHDAYQVADGLAHTFDASVANYSLAGGGPTGAMVAFIQSGTLDEGGYDLVVWESPYTVPLNDPQAMRQVLGTLRAARLSGALDIGAASISDEWLNMRHSFDAGGFQVLNVDTPGLSEGRLIVELIGTSGAKTRVKMTKSNRVPAERRSERWSLALTDLADPAVARIKLRLEGAKVPQHATVTLTR